MDAAKVSSERVLVVPHLAKQFLEMNHPLNRNRRATHIQFWPTRSWTGDSSETGSKWCLTPKASWWTDSTG